MVCYEVSFFFFKQKTSYEMRISDWSSDVCSSDLPAHPHRVAEDDAGVLEALQALPGGTAGEVDPLRQCRQRQARVFGEQGGQLPVLLVERIQRCEACHSQHGPACAMTGWARENSHV